MKPAQKRDVVRFLEVGFTQRVPVSERRACAVVGVSRSSQRYRSQASDQAAQKMRLRDLAATRVRYGYRRLHVLLQREGWHINHKRVYRRYRQAGLSLRLQTRKKRRSALRVVPPPAQMPNEQWSMDVMTDCFTLGVPDGRRFRILTIVDNMTRESPAIEVDMSLPSTRVVAVLERLAQSHGIPKVIYVDNGPEFVAKALDEWAHRHNVKLAFSRPGKPIDNPYIAAFNGRLRAACLDQHWFTSLADAQARIEAWRVDDNTVRPHTALQHLAPVVYTANWLQTRQAGAG